MPEAPVPHAIETPFCCVEMNERVLLRGLLICRGGGNGMGALGSQAPGSAGKGKSLHFLRGVWGPGHAKRRGALDGQTPCIRHFQKIDPTIRTNHAAIAQMQNNPDQEGGFGKVRPRPALLPRQTIEHYM